MALRLTRLGKAFGLGTAVVLEADAGDPSGSKTFNRKQFAHRQKRNSDAKASRRRNRRQRRGQRR